MAAAAYTPMGSSMYGIGSMSAMGGVYSGTVRGIGGRKNAAPGGLGWSHWLDGMTAGEGNPFLYEDGGVRYYDEAELALRDTLNRVVRVAGTKKKGVLSIEFYGEEDLKNLLHDLKLHEV